MFVVVGPCVLSAGGWCLLLFDVCRLLCVVCCLLFVVCCLLFVGSICGSLFAFRCSLLVVCLLFTVCCLLVNVCCSSFVVVCRFLLLGVCCLLSLVVVLCLVLRCVEPCGRGLLFLVVARVLCVVCYLMDCDNWLLSVVCVER